MRRRVKPSRSSAPEMHGNELIFYFIVVCGSLIVGADEIK
jgi:hypothetical protein